MDIQTISYNINELKYFDSTLTEKLNDAGFVYAESLTYRSFNYFSTHLKDILTSDEMEVLFYSLSSYLTLLRIRSMNEDLAKAILDNYVLITSIPYANEEMLHGLFSQMQEDITIEETIRIQRDTVIYLKSGKMIVNCLDDEDNNLTDVEILIPYPTEEDANRYYTFYPNNEGDVFIENVEYGTHDIYIKHVGNTYKKNITISAENIYRYRFNLHENIKIIPINEFIDGKSRVLLPEVSHIMKLDEIQDGESFKIIRLSDSKVTLLADNRIQNGATWLIRSIALSKSTFDFEYQINDKFVFENNSWVKTN